MTQTPQTPTDLFGLLHLLTDLADDSPGGRVAARMRADLLSAMADSADRERAVTLVP